MIKILLSVCIVFSLIGHSCFAQTLTPPDVVLNTFYTPSASPVGIYNCGDHRLFIIEQNEGDIEIIDTNALYIGKFLDLTGSITTGGERGLLGLAFHPNYANNGYFFVNYTDLSGNTTISRYHVSANANVADPLSATILLQITQPYSNHNGGHIAFGPDGFLYIGMGDGGSGGDPEGRAQNPQVLLGKMLRIDVNSGNPYAIPATNPFFGQTDTLPEIWALGTRNPWQFSFDKANGDLWIGDVGQNLYEEIDYEPSGSAGGMNWGWRCYEGNTAYNSLGCQPPAFYDFPVKVHTHAEGYCAITGGIVYRGVKYPNLDGIYFFSDFCKGDIMALTPNGSGGFDEANLYAGGNAIAAFGTDSKGEIYVVKSTGYIYKMSAVCPFYPSISSNGNGSLAANSGTQYWWYKDDVLIDGATSSSFTPTSSGTYYAHISNGSCTRQSNSIQWIVQSGVGGCTYANAVNYNSNAEIDDGSCLFSVNCDCPADLDANGQVTVADLLLFIGEFGTFCYE